MSARNSPAAVCFNSISILAVATSLFAADPPLTGSAAENARSAEKKSQAYIEQQLNPKIAESLQRPQPRVLLYDNVNDKFIYIDSRANDYTRTRPGGTLAYYSTRLSQYRFYGPANRGGLYTDMEDYKVQTQADPAKYQYRLGSYSRNGGR